MRAQNRRLHIKNVDFPIFNHVVPAVQADLP